jgi:uncharacterized protein YndB with AHSA1/START domain
MSAKAETLLGDDELLIVRTFDAPVSLVFRLWEKREDMMRWMGPRNFTCTSLDLDFRPGGAWRACVESEAASFWMGGQYREIERDRRIVFTFVGEDESGRPSVETLVTVTFSERDGKTVQSFHQTSFPTVESRDSHLGGWDQVFDKQQAYAERLAKGAQP